jgi:transcriptional regulator with XRE-family HTH domain
MPKRRTNANGDAEPITTAVRRAIEKSGLSRYQIFKATGIDQGTLSRFVRGQHGLSTVSLDKLAPVLGLQLIVKPQSQRKAK